MNTSTQPRRFDYEEEDLGQNAQIPFIISAPNMAGVGSIAAARNLKLTGHTRRISTKELELVGPFMLFSSRSVLGRDPSMPIVLRLPVGPVSLRAVAVSYTQLDQYENNLGYLVAAGAGASSFVDSDLNCVIRARITDISPNDRARLVKYLRTLENEETCQTVLVMDGNGMWREQTMTVTVMA